PTGFAAPYGQWSEDLNKALEQCGICFSSEFGLGYDDFPFYPIINSRLSQVLQMPVHPMCVSRLRQARHKREAVLDYYKNYLRTRYKAGETLFLYDHPHTMADQHETFDALFRLASRASDIWYTTMSEFREWWLERAASELEVVMDARTVQVGGCYDASMTAHIIDGDQEALVPMLNRSFELDDLNWQEVKYHYPYQSEMARGRQMGRHIQWREKLWKVGGLLRI
ncbi:MAG: hypothetical protein ABIK62_05930, partial [candidate division WOR-3 bacterium]